MPAPLPKLLLAVGRAAQLGFAIALPLVALIFLGLWLDKRWGTAPIFVITGIVLSLILTAYQMRQLIKSSAVS